MTGAGQREDRERRVGLNEALFREVNERIGGLTEDFRSVQDSMTIVCECGDAVCVERFQVEVAGYERVRANPLRFLVVPGHQAPDVERVVEELPTCLVVEKDKGAGAEVAEQTDPRA